MGKFLPCGGGRPAGDGGERVRNAGSNAGFKWDGVAGENLPAGQSEAGVTEPCLHALFGEAEPTVLEFLAEPEFLMLEEVVHDQGAARAQAMGEVGKHAAGVLEVVENLDDGDDVGFVPGEGGVLRVCKAEFGVGEAAGAGFFTGHGEHGFGMVHGDELPGPAAEEFEDVPGAGADVGDDKLFGEECAEDGAAEGFAEEVLAEGVPSMGELVEELGGGAGVACFEDGFEPAVVGGEGVVLAPCFLQGGPQDAGFGGEFLLFDAVVAP